MTKPVIVFVAVIALFLFIGAGALAWLSVGQLRDADQRFASINPSGSVQAAAPGVDSERFAALERSMQAMQDQFRSISAQVDKLSSSSDRAPVSLSAAPTESAKSVAALSPEAKDAMRAVIAEEAKRVEDQKAAERDQRDRVQAERRAERIAKELNMTVSDQQKLADLMVLEGKKRREMFTPMQDGNFDGEAMRTSFEEYRTWRNDELTRAFGPALSEQIQGMDRGPMGRGGRGGRGGGGDGGGPGGPGGGGPPPGGGGQ